MSKTLNTINEIKSVIEQIETDLISANLESIKTIDSKHSKLLEDLLERLKLAQCDIKTFQEKPNPDNNQVFDTNTKIIISILYDL